MSDIFNDAKAGASQVARQKRKKEIIKTLKFLYTFGRDTALWICIYKIL